MTSFETDNNFFDGFRCWITDSGKHMESRVMFPYKMVVMIEDHTGVFKQRAEVCRVKLVTGDVFCVVAEYDVIIEEYKQAIKNSYL